MSQSPSDHNPVPLAGYAESPSVPAADRNYPPLISQQARLLDAELMRQVLSGLLKPPPRVTVKAIVEQHLPAIRAARRRGWSIAQIADELVMAGIQINEATLRKYLSQLDRAKPTTGRAASKPTAPQPLSPVAPEASALPRRSLRRSAHMSSQLFKSEK